jgi:hypothetical protein
MTSHMNTLNNSVFYSVSVNLNKCIVSPARLSFINFIEESKRIGIIDSVWRPLADRVRDSLAVEVEIYIRNFIHELQR